MKKYKIIGSLLALIFSINLIAANGYAKKNLLDTNINKTCTNMDFESGDFSGWHATHGYHYGYGVLTGDTLLLDSGFVSGRHEIVTGLDSVLCKLIPEVAPGGIYSVKLGNDQSDSEAEQLIQDFIVDQPNQVYTYKYAAIVETPFHPLKDSPYFKAEMYDSVGLIIPGSTTIITNGTLGLDSPAVCGAIGMGIKYKNWTSVHVDLSAYFGKKVKMIFTSADCTQGAHFGYAYIDGECLKTPTGISSNAFQNKLQIFPNPIADELKFKIYLREAQPLEVFIFDITGKLLLSEKVNATGSGFNDLHLPIDPNLSSGIYHVNIVSKSGEILGSSFCK